MSHNERWWGEGARAHHRDPFVLASAFISDNQAGTAPLTDSWLAAARDCLLRPRGSRTPPAVATMMAISPCPGQDLVRICQGLLRDHLQDGAPFMAALLTGGIPPMDTYGAFVFIISLLLDEQQPLLPLHKRPGHGLTAATSLEQHRTMKERLWQQLWRDLLPEGEGGAAGGQATGEHSEAPQPLCPNISGDLVGNPAAPRCRAVQPFDDQAVSELLLHVGSPPGCEERAHNANSLKLVEGACGCLLMLGAPKGSVLTGDLDRILPAHRGGAVTISNTQLLHWSINRGVHAKGSVHPSALSIQRLFQFARFHGALTLEEFRLALWRGQPPGAKDGQTRMQWELKVLCSVLSALCSLISDLCSLLSALCSLLLCSCAVCSVHCALCGVRCAVCGVCCAVCVVCVVCVAGAHVTPPPLRLVSAFPQQKF